VPRPLLEALDRRRSRAGGEPVGIPWVVALGFVRRMTTRTAMMRPLPATRALAHVRSWLAWPSVDALHPGPRHLDLLEAFASAGAIQASLVTDAHVAAIAIERAPPSIPTTPISAVSPASGGRTLSARGDRGLPGRPCGRHAAAAKRRTMFPPAQDPEPPPAPR